MQVVLFWTFLPPTFPCPFPQPIEFTRTSWLSLTGPIQTVKNLRGCSRVARVYTPRTTLVPSVQFDSGRMNSRKRTFVWIETLLLMLLGLSQIQCSQDESLFSYNGPKQDQGGDGDGGAGNGAGKTWIETKSLTYTGQFHAQALFVIDNSASMYDELSTYINTRIATFMNTLQATPGLTYQIGITDTNFNDRQGLLHQSANGTKILTQLSPSNTFTEIFQSFIDSEDGYNVGVERGLAAASAAVLREQSTLFGPVASDKALSRRVIIISDQDDTDPFTPITDYTANLKSISGLSLHPIVALPGQRCSIGPREEGYGQRYVNAVAIVGGQARSICQPDFEASLNSVFEWIQNVCMKLDAPVVSRDRIEFWVNGVANTSFTLDDTRTQVCISLPNSASTLRVDAHHIGE